MATITGYEISQALRVLNLELSSLLEDFAPSLKAYDGETKDKPEVIADRIEQTQSDITRLQEIQTHYNLGVFIDVKGHQMSLCRLIKLVGPAMKASKMWKEALKPAKNDIYSFREESRNKDTEYAKPTITRDQCVVNAKRAEKYLVALRAAIAIGNGTKIALEIEDRLLEKVRAT